MRHFLYLLLPALIFTSCNDNIPELEPSTQDQPIPENLSAVAQKNIDNEASQMEYLSGQYNLLPLSEIDRNKLLSTSANSSESNLELAKKYNNLGNQHYKSDDYEIALFYYLSSLNLKLGTENVSGLALSFRNLALTFQALGDYRNAAISFWQAYYLYEILGDAPKMAKLLNDLGVIYDLAHGFVKLEEFAPENSHALSYYSKSIELHRSINNLEAVLQTEGNIELFYNTYLEKGVISNSRTGGSSRNQEDVEDEI